MAGCGGSSTWEKPSNYTPPEVNILDLCNNANDYKDNCSNANMAKRGRPKRELSNPELIKILKLEIEGWRRAMVMCDERKNYLRAKITRTEREIEELKREN